jgi:hypothetical protein
LLVLLCLAAFADHDGRAFPNISAVALCCSTKQAGVNQAIEELINSGELRLTRFGYKDPDGDMVPPEYQILVAPPYGESQTASQPNAPLECEGLRGAAYRIDAHLLLCSNGRGQASESFSGLAKICRLSRKTVINSIKRLEVRGLLKVVRTAQAANVYWLDPPVGSFELIRQLWLMAKWLELQYGAIGYCSVE